MDMVGEYAGKSVASLLIYLTPELVELVELVLENILHKKRAFWRSI